MPAFSGFTITRRSGRGDCCLIWRVSKHPVDVLSRKVPGMSDTRGVHMPGKLFLKSAYALFETTPNAKLTTYSALLLKQIAETGNTVISSR